MFQVLSAHMLLLGHHIGRLENISIWYMVLLDSFALDSEAPLIPRFPDNKT